VDPELDVFGPAGSGSVIILYGSGSFHPQAKKVRKTLISTILLLIFVFLYVRTDVNVPSKSNTQINFGQKKIIFCWHLVSN
jgi:hypothetical protein